MVEDRRGRARDLAGRAAKALTFLVFGIDFLLMLAPPAVAILALSGVLS